MQESAIAIIQVMGALCVLEALILFALAFTKPKKTYSKSGGTR